MLAGERPNKTIASAYRHNTMRPFAEAFLDTVQNIYNEATVDFYQDPTRAMNNRASVEALREFFVNDSCDPEGFEDPEAYNEHVEDMEALFENDRQAVMEHVVGSTVAPMVGMAFPMHKYHPE